MKFCVQRGFKDIQQEVEKKRKTIIYQKMLFTIVKRNKEKGVDWKERKMYQKGVANGSQEGK